MSDLSLLDQAIHKLHAEGGRMTSQRRLILETLENCSNHPTAEEIFEQAHRQDSALHLSTVYRTLRWLQEEGLVNPCWFEDEHRQERFDPVTAENPDHDHFRCRICNAIIEFSEPLLEDIKSNYLQRYGGQIESATLTLYGVCDRCLNPK